MTSRRGVGIEVGDFSPPYMEGFRANVRELLEQGRISYFRSNRNCTKKPLHRLVLVTFTWFTSTTSPKVAIPSLLFTIPFIVSATMVCRYRIRMQLILFCPLHTTWAVGTRQSLYHGKTRTPLNGVKCRTSSLGERVAAMMISPNRSHNLSVTLCQN